jgi:hypothetical protein
MHASAINISDQTLSTIATLRLATLSTQVATASVSAAPRPSA